MPGDARIHVPFKHSVSAKLLKIVFAVYILIAAVVTLLHMIVEFQEMKSGILQELEILERAFGRSLAAAVWYMDPGLLDSEMHGILQHPMIIGATVRNDMRECHFLGETRLKTVESNKIVTGPCQPDAGINKKSHLIENAFPLIHVAEDGERYEVGAASLFSSKSLILDRLKLKFLLILLASTINMVAFWALVLLIGRRILSRPLAIMTDYARNLDMDSPEQCRMDLGVKDRNEFKVLEEAFNGMIQMLLNSREQLQDLNRRLERRRDELELNVRERTRDLEESERRLSQIIEFLPDATLGIDTEGTVIAWNRAMENLTGVKAADMLGKGDYEYAVPFYGRKQPVMIDLVLNDNTQTASRYQPLRREGTRLESETCLPDFRGRGPTWVWLAAAPLYDDAGRITGAIESIRDISALKQAENALRLSEERFKKLYREAKKTEELYHSLLNSTLDAIVAYDLEGSVTYVNEGFTKTFGWEKEELAEGVPYTPESEREITNKNVRRVVRDGFPLKDFETTRLTKEGYLINVSISASRFNDHEGAPAGMLVILRDITEWKKTENLLHEAKEAAEAAARIKSEFLANMSHEIRTPLNAILGLSHLALETQMTPKQLDYQQKIHASANTLLRLINDILDFSKIEAGKLDMERRDFSLEEVLESVTSFIKARSAQKGLTFSTSVDASIPPRLMGDSLRLGQVIANLASNAVKFTQKGDISISVEPVGTTDRDVTLRITVADTGIGMDQEQIDQLFEPFQQADASISRKYGGTGLGLAISKRLIEMMEGDIRVDSEPGAGTRFTFTARFGKSEKEKPARLDVVSREQAAELLANLHILLVEDNEINMQVARELLEHVGVRVTAAPNGRIALELARREQLDCILMDLHMPMMDGLTAAREIRKRVAQSDVPIIAMTASAMAGDRKRCLEAGMNDHIPKPIKPSNLYETLIRRLRPDAYQYFSQKILPEPAATGGTGDFPAINGVNVSAGLNYVNGDQDLFLKVLKNMYNRYQEIVPQIRKEMDSGSVDAALRQVHTLKGVAGTVGAEVLYKRALALESTLKNKQTDRIPALTDALSEEVDRVMAALAQLFPENSDPEFESHPNNGSIDPADAERMKEVFSQLTALVDEGNPDALSLVSEIKKLPGSSGITKRVLELEARIDNYEFEDARDILDAILNELDPRNHT